MSKRYFKKILAQKNTQHRLPLFQLRFTYSSRSFRKLLGSLDIEPSMSRRGNCWDNTVADSFFSNLKKEKIRRIKYKTRDDARQAMFHYIEMFYNPKGRHTNNCRLSPTTEYDRQYFRNMKSV